MINKIITLNEIRKHEKIILWGAGVYTEEVIELLGREKIVAITDSSPQKWGIKIANIEVKSPVEIMNEANLENAIFLISVASYNYEIALHLQQKWGINPDAIFCFTHKFAEKYMYDIEAIKKGSKEITKTLEILGDSDSREYFENLLRAKQTRNPLFLKENPNITGSYCYNCGENKVEVKTGDVILDCGAFTGDTAKTFIEKTYGNCKIYCFEPLSGNFDKLNGWVTENRYDDKIVCVQALLGEKEGKTIIVSPEKMSVEASEVQDGKFKNEVSIRTIDSYMNEKVDFIKMDIEGSELKALKGAKRLIKECKPQMVISAYHRTSHLWEIPLLIKAIEPTYRIYLGHQLNAAFEPEYYVTI